MISSVRVSVPPLFQKVLLAGGLAIASACVHAQAQPVAGTVRLSDIKIQKSFERTKLTKENFGGFMSTCLPTFTETAKDRFIAEWRLPLMNSTMALAHAQSPGFVQISGDSAICVRESENRFPIVATDAFKGTANPEGVTDEVLEDFYAKIAYTLAERGYADVSYVFKQGNVQHVTYRVDRNDRGQLYYLETFRKKEFFQPVQSGLTIDLPESARFSVTRSNGRVAKPFFDAK